MFFAKSKNSLSPKDYMLVKKLVSQDREKPLVLVTGGAGYVGTNVCYQLLGAGFDIVTVDNYSTGRESAIEDLKKSKEQSGRLVLAKKMDIVEQKQDLIDLFNDVKPDTVVHLAASIVVDESNREPGRYFQQNVVGTEHIIDAMEKSRVTNCLFASSAAVYGDTKPKNNIALSEEEIIEFNHMSNVYAITKRLDEIAFKQWQERVRGNFIAFRFFNVAGAGGLNKEFGYNVWPPTHLLPSAVVGSLDLIDFKITSPNDLPTRDGTTVRDYIHVTDIARGFVKGLRLFNEVDNMSEIINLGSGEGQSVLEIINAVKETTGVNFPVEKGKQRTGESPILLADISKAKRILEWKPEKQLFDCINDFRGWFVSETFRGLHPELFNNRHNEGQVSRRKETEY